MPKLPAPPVPQKLRELLKDYPEYIASSQEILNTFSKPAPRLQPFDEAVWLLEDGLADFLAKASMEWEAAKSGGDAVAIEQATKRVESLSLARGKFRWITDEGLWNYFQENKEAFE